ncbi:hypothetical protein PI125_g23832 [Phytophthora idaei]|nr:hypothetical protein PI125_g23832 [Phytophthora idaei]
MVIAAWVLAAKKRYWIALVTSERTIATSKTTKT